jgi:ABC-type transporter Mla subunit MlaD
MPKMPPPIDDMTDLDRPVTRRELREDLQAFVTKDQLREELKALATKEDLKAVRDELRTHFTVVAEQFKEECHILFDGLKATTGSLGSRLETIETVHGARLSSLETRTTQLEARSKRR